MTLNNKTNDAPQTAIPALYMRGGTSKGVFFKLTDLPKSCQVAGRDRDKLLLRVMGSPDPYGKQIDGLGNGSSSTSKAVILSTSETPNHDVNYLFAQVNVIHPMIDWSGNCGNLSAAVGAAAIHLGLVANVPKNGICSVRIWQENIGKTLIAHVPITNGQVQETGNFYLDGVAFPAAEINVDFVSPVDGDMFPTGNVVDDFTVPNIGAFQATFINAGIPTIFLTAKDLGFDGTELQADINSNPELLSKLETIRANAGVAMGLFLNTHDAKVRQHTPKLAWVAPKADYTASSGAQVSALDIDLLVRAMSMGQLHHAMMGTAAVAIAAAAAVKGTLVNIAAGGKDLAQVRFGHPSGTLFVGATVNKNNDGWQVERVTMSRSARRIMAGNVFVT